MKVMFAVAPIPGLVHAVVSSVQTPLAVDYNGVRALAVRTLASLKS